MNRFQRTSKPGVKLDPHTLCVNRGTHFGNPFVMRNEADRDRVVIEFREWLKQPEQDALCREFIQRCLKDGIEHIACFCPVESVCHGDVWLELWDHYDQFVLLDLIGWNGKKELADAKIPPLVEFLSDPDKFSAFK